MRKYSVVSSSPPIGNSSLCKNETLSLLNTAQRPLSRSLRMGQGLSEVDVQRQYSRQGGKWNIYFAYLHYNFCSDPIPNLFSLLWFYCLKCLFCHCLLNAHFIPHIMFENVNEVWRIVCNKLTEKMLSYEYLYVHIFLNITFSVHIKTEG